MARCQHLTDYEQIKTFFNGDMKAVFAYSRKLPMRYRLNITKQYLHNRINPIPTPTDLWGSTPEDSTTLIRYINCYDEMRPEIERIMTRWLLQGDIMKPNLNFANFQFYKELGQRDRNWINVRISSDIRRAINGMSDGQEPSEELSAKLNFLAMIDPGSHWALINLAFDKHLKLNRDCLYPPDENGYEGIATVLKKMPEAERTAFFNTHLKEHANDLLFHAPSIVKTLPPADRLAFLQTALSSKEFLNYSFDTRTSQALVQMFENAGLGPGETETLMRTQCLRVDFRQLYAMAKSEEKEIDYAVALLSQAGKFKARSLHPEPMGIRDTRYAAAVLRDKAVLQDAVHQAMQRKETKRDPKAHAVYVALDKICSPPGKATRKEHPKLVDVANGFRYVQRACELGEKREYINLKSPTALAFLRPRPEGPATAPPAVLVC